MTKIIITAIFGLMLVTRGVASETAIQDSHAKAATELLLTMHFEKQMSAGMEMMADVMIKQNAMLAPFRSVLLKWAAGFMTWDTFGSQVVAFYEATFTEAELRDLTAFYKTPTGQKALTEMPKLSRQMMELGSSVAKDHVQELEPLMRARSAEIEQLSAKP
jgi:uncharacterized protein